MTRSGALRVVYARLVLGAALGLALISTGPSPRAQGPVGPVSPLYMTGVLFGAGPNTPHIKVAQGGGVINAWDQNGLPPTMETAIAVYTSVKTLGGTICSGGGCPSAFRSQYTLTGAVIDSIDPGPVPLASPTQTDYLYDGATDGTLNYSVGNLTRNVYSFNKDWGQFKKLFTLPVPPGGGSWLGITYDRTDDSLWISSPNNNPSNTVVHYTKSGTLLGSFLLDMSSGYNTTSGLALDNADDTLWAVRINTSSAYSVRLEQYAKDGTLLGWMTAPELQNFDSVGAEFPSGPPDLVVTSLTEPPVSASPGNQYGVTDTTLNQGVSPAIASTTRIYLSTDTVRNTGDRLLSPSRAVPALASGVDSNGLTTVTIPTSMPAGTYYQLACADDQKKVKEGDETNNCRASTNTMEVVIPDLVVSAISNPPASAAPGSKFTINDTVLNQGTGDALATSTRYFLSVDDVKDAGDVLLGTRSVPALAAGASSPGSKLVTVPASTPLTTYRVLACADGQSKVTESNEGNNCTAAALSVVVAYPDLVPSAVGDPPVSVLPGQKINATDTVLNQGSGAAGISSTRYYLSLDAIWSAGDVLLTGSRSVVALAPGASSGGSKLVTVPLGTAAGSYRLIACADDTKKVAEDNEANNCAASAGSVTVGP